MSKSKLAVFGGEPARKKPFDSKPFTDDEEISLIISAIKNNEFSRYSGPYLTDITDILKTKSVDAVDLPGYWHFLGGRNARTFESDFSKYFGIDYSIAINSATTGLSVALAACDVGPGDEVITTPLTFTASSSSILLFNAIPVFVDVDPDTFNIDPNKIEEKITENTKAILLVHLFGNSCEMDPIMDIARKYNLKVIEDCAQSIGVKYKGHYVGTIGDLGVFSFQQTKNIMTGEGGMITTNDMNLARKCRLIRNHGEGAIYEEQPIDDMVNIIGCNFRMTELSAAIGIGQLKKLDYLNKIRNENAFYLMKELSGFPAIKIPKINKWIDYISHILALKFEEEEVGFPRSVMIEALRGEGIPVTPGYLRLTYENPTFLKQIAYGSKGCPFKCGFYKGNISYYRGMCPVAEDLIRNKFLWFFQISYPFTIEDMKDIVNAFNKIFENKEDLILNKNILIEKYNRSLGGVIR